MQINKQAHIVIFTKRERYCKVHINSSAYCVWFWKLSAFSITFGKGNSLFHTVTITVEYRIQLQLIPFFIIIMILTVKYVCSCTVSINCYIRSQRKAMKSFCLYYDANLHSLVFMFIVVLPFASSSSHFENSSRHIQKLHRKSAERHNVSLGEYAIVW